MTGDDEIDDDLTATQEALRGTLLVCADTVSPGVLASALSYELASLIASRATDMATAVEMVWSFADAQVAQIRALGVGKLHP